MFDDTNDSPGDARADQRLDLHALDPDADPAAQARFIDAVMTRVAEQRTLYPAPADPLWGVWSLARPLIAAAAVLLVVAGAMTVRARQPRPDVPRTVAEAVGIPPEFLTAITRPVSR